MGLLSVVATIKTIYAKFKWQVFLWACLSAITILISILDFEWYIGVIGFAAAVVFYLLWRRQVGQRRLNPLLQIIVHFSIKESNPLRISNHTTIRAVPPDGSGWNAETDGIEPVTTDSTRRRWAGARQRSRAVPDFAVYKWSSSSAGD